MSVAQSSKQNRLTDGFLTAEGGVDSGFAPTLIGVNQFSWAVNSTFRGGYPKARPGFVKQTLSVPISGLFQGAGSYLADSGQSYIVMSVGGRIFTVNISTGFTVSEITIPGDPNQPLQPHAWFQQAENWLIVQNMIDTAFLWDGATSRRAVNTLPKGGSEVPIGGPMAYGKGRLWVANQNAYVGGDLVGVDPYGRDNVIRFTENTFLNEGGSFAVPGGNITGLAFAANLDTSLGQGDLLVHTPNSVLAFEAPEDRTQWKNLDYPIQRFALLNYGSVNHESITVINGDLFYRSQDGIRSLVYARRNFQTWGNTSISRPVTRGLQYDTLSRLGQCSSVNFDNRFLMTVEPQNVNGFGTIHSGLAALDYDLVGGFGRQNPATWEGVWTGLRILRILTVRVNLIDRCYVIALSPTNTIEIWELTRSALFDQNGTDDVPISWILETRADTFGNPKSLKQITGAEAWYDQLAGEMTATVKYKSNLSECWTNWMSFTDCAQYRSCAPADPGDCQAVRYFRGVSRSRMGLPQPPRQIDPQTFGFSDYGYNFQTRFEFTGRFRLTLALKVAQDVEEQEYATQSAITCPIPDGSDATCSTGCAVQECCDPSDFGYNSYGT